MKRNWLGVAVNNRYPRAIYGGNTMRKFLIILMSIGMAGGLFARDIENWSSTINGTAKVTTDDAGTATLTVDSIVADNTVNNSGSLTVTNAGGEGTITVYGGETNGASVTLKADNGDDAGDSFKMAVDTSENFSISGDNGSKGTFVNILTLTSAGAATLVGDLTVSGGDVAGLTGTSIDLGEATAGKVTITGTNVGIVGTTAVTGTFDANSVTVDAGAGIDNQAEGTLLVGASTASKVEIADTGIETEVQGPLDVNGNADFDGTVASAITASANVTSNTFAVAAITTENIILNSQGEAFSITLPAPTVAGQKLTVIASSAQTTNAFVIPDDGTLVECGSDITLSVNDTASFVALTTAKWLCVGNHDND